MIVVIADDLAGAGEMGGMALRHGLTARVQFEFDAHADVDVIVIDTDTRSCTAGEVARRVAGWGSNATSRARRGTGDP